MGRDAFDTPTGGWFGDGHRRRTSLSVIVHDLDIVGPVGLPDKADAELIVDADAVLTNAVAVQGLEPIGRGNANVVEAGGGLQLIQFTQCRGESIVPDPALAGDEETVGVLALEGLDHRLNI